MSHHNEGPGLSPVKLEPTVKLEQSENGHAVTMTGNSSATRHRRRPILNKDHNRARKLKEYRQKIISNYLPLHRELYTLNPTSFFVPSFLKAINDNTEQSFKSIMSEPSPGIFAFEIFQPSFCELLLSEIENFEKWVTEVEFQIMRPNSLNRYGAVLDDFGLETMLEKLMDGFIRPLSKVLYAEVGGSTLDSHHGFVVEYGKDRDVDLGFHVDDSEVTLNVCLGKEFSGGELYFRGTRCERHVNTGIQSEEIFDYSHVPGRAVLHRGRHRHGARATTSGHRVNLLLWCRSSAFREMARYQTDFSSWCGECNRVKKERQCSTVAATKLFSPIAPSLVPSNITSSKTKMGVHAYSSRISAITWIIGSLIMVINTYYLMTSFINPLLHSHLEIGAKVFLGILGFSGMGVYLAGIAYLVLRKTRKATHLWAPTALESQQIANKQVKEHVINF